MSRQNVVNKFGAGVNSDISPESVDNNTLIAGKNISITTNDNNQLVLQKAGGSKEVLNGYNPNLKPLAVSEYNDVVYIVSYDTDQDVVEYGTFPSIASSDSIYQEVEGSSTHPPTVTSIGIPDIGFTSTAPIIIPQDPQDYAEFTVQNNSAQTIEYSLNSSVAYSAYKTSEDPFTNKTLSPGESAIYRISGSYDIGENTADAKIQLVIHRVDTQETRYIFGAYVMSERALIFDFNIDNMIYMTAASYDLQSIEAGPVLKYKDGPMQLSRLWYGESFGSTLSKIVMFNKRGNLVGAYTMPSGKTEMSYNISYGGKTELLEYSLVEDVAANSVVWNITSMPSWVTFAYIDIDYLNKYVTIPGYTDDMYAKLSLPGSPPDLITNDTLSRQFYTVTFDPLYPEYRLAPQWVSRLQVASWGDVTLATIGTNGNIVPFNKTLVEVGGFIELKNNSDTATVSSTDFVLRTDGTDSLQLQYEATLAPSDVFSVDNVYGPLNNFSTNGTPETSELYNEPFRTAVFGYTKDSSVDIEIQPSYDGSVNILTACEGTPPRIVNSRQVIEEDSGYLIYRGGGSLENVYSEESIEKTRLVPFLGNTVVDLTFMGVETGGVLPAAGYKYYFKLVTSDGVESEIIEQSRLVSVHFGSGGDNSRSSLELKNTNKSVRFKLSNLVNKNYRFVSVYFAQFLGETDTTVASIGKITTPFEIIDEECTVVHTGRELTEDVDSSELLLEYTPISSASTINQKNGRLLVGNVTITDTQSQVLKTQALKIFPSSSDAVATIISEQLELGLFFGEESSYADPNNIYNYLGYMPGETYEFGVNFVFENGNTSDTYPMIGVDFNNNTEDVNNYLGTDFSWLSDGTNSKGVVRTIYKDINSIIVNGHVTGQLKAHTIAIDTSNVDNQALRAIGVTSFFISRRRRIPDMAMEGMITATASIPTKTSTTKESAVYNLGNYSGIGFTGSNAHDNYCVIPAPMCGIPYSFEKLTTSGKPYDTIVYAPIAEHEQNKHFAFYSPDIACDGAKSATIYNNSNDFSINLKNGTKGTPRHVFEPFHRIGISSNSELLPRVSYLTRRNTEPTPDYNLINLKMSYVYDGYRSLTPGTFTSRSDRQASFLVHNDLQSDNSFRHSFQTSLILFASCDSKDYAYTYNNISSLVTDVDKKWLMSNVTYLPYVGITLDDVSELSTYLNYNTPSFTPNVVYTASIFTNSPDTFEVKSYPNNVPQGLMCTVYNNRFGTMLPLSYWKSRYSVDRNDSYFAISKRMSVSNEDFKTSSMPLTGGDCYVGFYYQQVWRPGGVDGIPTASDPTAYTDDRSGTGIVNSGYALVFPVRSSYNFNLRSGIDGTDSEYSLYNSQRTYLSKATVKNLRGIKRPETDSINYGNFQEGSVVEKQVYDDSIPYTETSQQNRVYVSAAASTNQFENGYRDFKGFNFRDYDEANGPITSIVSNGVYTYIVYRGGVSLIEVLERSTIQSTTGNNVYIANADVLPEKAVNVLPFLGSKYKNSVISTEYGIFGVDSDRKKIWSINGTAPALISDSRIQSIINPWITSELKDIITSYDQTVGDVVFNFIYNDDTSKAVVFNGRLNVWYGTTDNKRQYQFSVNQTNYDMKNINGSFRIFTPQDTLKNVTEYYDSGYVKESHESYFEFVVANEARLKAVLNNLVINGSGVPSSIDIYPESSGNFSIEKLGITDTRDEPCSTNVFILDTSSPTVIDEFTIRRSTISSSIDYKVGDHITITQNSKDFKFIVADVLDMGEYVLLTLNRPMDLSKIGTVEPKLYYGWKVPIRLKLMEVDNGQLRISVPPKLLANNLAGITTDKVKSTKNRDSAKPSGRWFKVRINFDGIDPVYINSIISDIGLIYS